MAQEMGPAPGGELTDQDKLMAALSYPIPIVAIIILLVEDMKKRAFQKYHAVQALGFAVAMLILAVFLCIVVSVLQFIPVVGQVLGCLMSLVFLVPLAIAIYYAYQAYQGQYFNIPVITDFIKGQGWV